MRPGCNPPLLLLPEPEELPGANELPLPEEWLLLPGAEEPPGFVPGLLLLLLLLLPEVPGAVTLPFELPGAFPPPVEVPALVTWPPVGPPEELLLPDGELLLPDGELPLPDGELPLPDGELPLPDGKLLLPDGELLLPDGDWEVLFVWPFWEPEDEFFKEFGSK